MDRTTLRILDALARSLGRPPSIRALTAAVRRRSGTAYYANVYRKVQELARDDLVALEKAGAASLASLNLDNRRLIDLLAELELRNTQAFLQGRPAWGFLLRELEQLGFASLCLSRPEQNARLNRAEVLGLGDGRPWPELQRLAEKHDLRLDCLLLSEREFRSLLAGREANPAKDLLIDKIAFFSPQAFWLALSSAAVRIPERETDPAKLPERDLLFNLARFGYRELGPRLQPAAPVCLEYLVTALLLRGDARRVRAIPSLLAANPANLAVLRFLAQKHGVAAALARAGKPPGEPLPQPADAGKPRRPRHA